MDAVFGQQRTLSAASNLAQIFVRVLLCLLSFCKLSDEPGPPYHALLTPILSFDSDVPALNVTPADVKLRLLRCKNCDYFSPWVSVDDVVRASAPPLYSILHPRSLSLTTTAKLAATGYAGRVGHWRHLPLLEKLVYFCGIQCLCAPDRFCYCHEP